jgi:1-aminocyclopropane-1-carboxylate deaminase/D-cysteine desulfhydrase-like pyridoxal-dependent ACC family enzyme
LHNPPVPHPWSHLPRIALTTLPTPLTPLPRFSEAIGAQVWMKRDDTGSLGLAGNKVRKLEFVLAEARAAGADTLLIVGAEQSNAARAAAAACAQLGLRCVLVLSGEEPGRPAANLLLDHLFGAEVRFAGTTDWAQLAAAADATAAELRDQGATPYSLPVGASSPLGAVGFAVAWHELLGQLDELDVRPDTVVHASSSGGTHAGLLLGRHMTGGGPRVRAIAVATGIHPDLAAATLALSRDAGRLVGVDHGPAPDDLILDCGFLGDGYAVPSPDGVAAIRLLAETEAIVCDPVYSGKALAAVVAAARAGDSTAPTIFWHTGGHHAVFAPPFDAALLGR